MWCRSKVAIQVVLVDIRGQAAVAARLAVRPDRIQLLVDRRIHTTTPGRFWTRVITDGIVPSLHVEYKRCHIKQYWKEGRALRTETTFNDTYDFRIGRGLSNFVYLRTLGQRINARLLHLERLDSSGS
jgi:hypothetical protein